MCGIYGAMWFTEQGRQFCAQHRDDLRKSSLLRGRDGHGDYEWDNGYLGVSRAQPLPEGEEIPLPMVYNSLVMVFNGTLSNDRELMEEYGLERRYDVDTYVAAELWEKKGVLSCNELVGGYAFGVYNKDNGSLTIAKNFKTLWCIRNADFFLFSSEKESLLFGSEDFLSPIYPMRFPQNSYAEIMPDGSYRTGCLTRKVWSSTPTPNENKALIVTSGGIDSVTAAYIAKKMDRKDVLLLHFDYGQRSEMRERAAVEYVTRDLGVPMEVIDISQVGQWGNSPLTDPNLILPLGMRSVESTLCWVPARNLLMLSYAASLAEARGYGRIYYGNNLEEEATGYSDNDVEFIYLMNEVLDYGTLGGIKIVRALARLMKIEIITLGAYLGVPYDKTWSCDEGFEKPCGICGCCTTRRYAFLRAGIPDGQEYLQPVRDEYPWTGVKVQDLDLILQTLSNL